MSLPSASNAMRDCLRVIALALACLACLLATGGAEAQIVGRPAPNTVAEPAPKIRRLSPEELAAKEAREAELQRAELLRSIRAADSDAQKRQLMRQGCDNDDATLCSMLAFDLFDPMDASGAPYALAAGKKACDLDEVQTCYLVGRMQQMGMGIEENPRGAREMFTRACDLGHGSACYELGSMAFDGSGGDQDVAAARVAIRRACELDSADDDAALRACAALITMNRNQFGGPTREEMIHMALNRRCTLEQGEDCYYLALRHRDGFATPQDTDKAVNYFSTACNLFYLKACEEREILLATLVEDEEAR